MAAFKTLDDLPDDLTGKVALVRVDLNLPMNEGRASDVTRVEASAPTILELADAGAKVLLLAHFGRPKGERYSTMSTSVVQGDVERVLGREVMFISELFGPVVEQYALWRQSRSIHIGTIAAASTPATPCMPRPGCLRLP